LEKYEGATSNNKDHNTRSLKNHIFNKHSLEYTKLTLLVKRTKVVAENREASKEGRYSFIHKS